MISEIVQTPSAVVVHLAGNVDSQSVQEIVDTMGPIWESLDRGLVYNMQGVDYMNSDGLRFFVMTAKMSQSRNIPFAVCCLSSFVAKILQVSMFSNFIPICATEAEAEQFVQQAMEHR